jgi:hypothetical protein
MGASDAFLLMPEDVKLWFDERASYLGWPPQGLRWRGVLRDHSVDYWARLRWEKRSVDLQQARFTEPTEHILEDLAAALIGGVQNWYASLDTSDKIPEIGQYIQEHHRLPGLLIFLEQDGVLDLVDGAHRLTVYRAVKSLPVPSDWLCDECEAWVGSLSSEISHGQSQA